MITTRRPAAEFLKASRPLVLPLVLAAILRIAWMIIVYLRTGTRIMLQGDTASYLEPGRNLILHSQYSTGGLPEIDRTPGYPIFVNLTGMLVNNALSVVVCQVALSLVSLVLVYRIANRVFRRQHLGLLAAWLYAIEPVSLVYTVRLMPETLFTTLLLCVIDRLLVYRSRGKLTSILSAALYLAAATYVRPVSYYLVVALAIGLAITSPGGRANWWKAPAVLILTCVGLLAFWQIRNQVQLGYPGFSSIVEKNLYFYQSAEVTAELQHISLQEQQQRLGYLDEPEFLALHPELRGAGSARRFSIMRRDAAKILSDNRWLYLKTHFAGVGVVAFTPCASELLELIDAYPNESTMPKRILSEGVFHSVVALVSTHPTVTAVMTILEFWLLVLYCLSLVGVWKGSGERFGVLLLAGIVIYFLLISGGAQAIGRYRLPVMPILCVFAAGGISVILSKKRQGSTKESPAEVA